MGPLSQSKSQHQGQGGHCKCLLLCFWPQTNENEITGQASEFKYLGTQYSYYKKPQYISLQYDWEFYIFANISKQKHIVTSKGAKDQFYIQFSMFYKFWHSLFTSIGIAFE